MTTPPQPWYITSHRMGPGIDAYTRRVGRKEIVLKKGLDPERGGKVVAHELAHALGGISSSQAENTAERTLREDMTDMYTFNKGWDSIVPDNLKGIASFSFFKRYLMANMQLLLEGKITKVEFARSNEGLREEYEPE